MMLHRFIDNFVKSNDYEWAWQSYKPLIFALQKDFQSQSLLEIGGGRSPLMTADEVERLAVRYTINDICDAELDRAPPWAAKARFDIAGEVPSGVRYDLMFSKMVFEHVKDVGAAYRNIYQVLEEGGVCVNFHPTLFAPPFVANYLLPEGLSQPLLRLAFPHRRPDAVPKFPAHYDWCFSTKGVRAKIAGLGFSEVVIVPFYGHGYFEGVPLVRNLDHWVSERARLRDFRYLTSYAYTIVRK